MQIVYISNRPAIFAETLGHVALFMEFIDQVLVCVPDHQRTEFESIQAKHPISVLSESEILRESELAELPDLDHQRRNYLLRTRLVRSDSVNDQFIMSDDDARPLKPIPIETFIRNGRYRRYFFYDLAHWNNNQTEFDAGQIATYAVLNHENLPHLSYASHMPQVINKNMFVEAVDFFNEYQKNQPLCEWSTYFNYATSRHSEKFHDEETYMTLCWPEHPLAWKLYLSPDRQFFENYTPSLYKNDRVFAHLSPNTVGTSKSEQEHKNIEKVILWRKHIINQYFPEQKQGLQKFLSSRFWVNKLFRHQHLAPNCSHSPQSDNTVEPKHMKAID